MVVAAIIGYLIGSIPVAVFVGRRAGVDPRLKGDGNPGWLNMRELVGDRLAVIVLIGDIAKGALAAYLGSLIWGPWWTAYDALIFAMVGNAFPVFAGGRGGRSTLTAVGGMLVLSPMPAFVAVGIFVIATIVTRRAIYGVTAGLVSFPIVQMFFDDSARVVWSLVLIAFIALRYAANTPSELVPGRVRTSL